jgi:hypothetical protein
MHMETMKWCRFEQTSSRATGGVVELLGPWSAPRREYRGSTAGNATRSGVGGTGSSGQVYPGGGMSQGTSYTPKQNPQLQ